MRMQQTILAGIADHRARQIFTLPRDTRMRINEIEAKSMLVKSKLPASDYVVNPYTGCSFGCAYCYASFMGRLVGQPIGAWGDFLSVKTNAVEVFRRDLARLPSSKRNATILLSSVTDAWQGPEKKYRLARGILEILRDTTYTGSVNILTKSPLILRDVDVIAALPRKQVGVTVTTTDDDVGRFIEASAPLASDRLRALAGLNAAGIPTYAFVGPLLPHYRFRSDLLEQLFEALKDAGTTTIFAEHLNTSRYILRRIEPLLTRADPEIRAAYESACTAEHRRAVSAIVMDLVDKYGFNIRLGRVLDHNEDRHQSHKNLQAQTIYHHG
jgi:DNA repair photolyase